MKIILRKLIYGFIYFAESLFSKKLDVVVTCYHGFSSDGWRFSVPIKEFKKQLNFLKQNYEFITIDDLRFYLENKKNISKPSVLITIDDGYEDVLETKDIFHEMKIKPLLFLLSNPDSADRSELGNKKKLLTEKQMKILVKEGWSFGSHGATHADFSKLSNSKIEEEVVVSKRNLEKMFGVSVKYFAYPKGRYTDKIVSAVSKSSYVLAFSMDDEIISPGVNKFTIPRVGVDGSHSFYEFSILFSFWAIMVRKIIKKHFPNFAL
ncbi:MAG: polysaccharide deacetylase family protein [Patescibacteria group bacterium]